MRISFKWLFPGLKLKRWIFLCLLGGLISIYAGSRFFVEQQTTANPLGALWVIFFVVGVILLYSGVILFIKSLIDVLAPHKKNKIIDFVFQERYLEKGPNIVVIGGGTGLSNLLTGLKKYTYNITAIVTVADEGGSSGILRKEFDILPPGDIRNCLVALADATELMRKLFQYRFDKGTGFEGHSFGNLFITAMREVTGNFDSAIKESSKILAIRGQVLPVSLDSIRIKAEYIDGSFVEGEDAIPQKAMPIKRIYLQPENVTANQEAIASVRNADLIILGPGSLYTSVLPVILVKDITQALKDSQGLKLYVCNVMTQFGETDGFTASMHLKTLLEHTSADIVDGCIVNSAASNTSRLLKYADKKSFPVLPDSDFIENMGFFVVEDDLISRENYIRHNPDKLAKTILDTYNSFAKNGKNRKEHSNKK